MRDIVIRMTFSGKEPIRLLATSANIAHAVHDIATVSDISSPVYTFIIYVL